MQTIDTLRKKISAIDGKDYGAYQSLIGVYEYGNFILFCEAGLIINAARVALTGQAVAPGLFEIMLVLGREITINRLQRLSEYLSAGAKE